MASSAPSLIGPPELYQDWRESSHAKPAAVSNSFMDLLVANFNSSISNKTRTENFSPTFLSTGNPCLDFFFHVVPDTPAVILHQRLASAWKHDPLTALKLVCNLRGVRRTGKSDREGYYTAVLWIHDHHPKTLACNVRSLADFGYFKDLPEILFRLLRGPDVRRNAEEQRRMKRRRPVRFAGRRPVRYAGRGRNKTRPILTEEVKNREEKRIAEAKSAIERYNRDPHYRFLYDRISDLFAETLTNDINNLKSDDSVNKKLISLAAKWCPSLDSSFDRSTLLCESIARKVFPRSNHPEYDGVEDAHYAYRVRDRLRKEILVPLRKALQLPEVYIGANQWGSIPYNRVASVAMKFYKEKFIKHDGERFQEYLDEVRTGKAKIAAGALLPHEIISSLNDSGGDVAELQWRRMIDDVSKKGKMKNCLAICDVSGSMFGIPMEVSVALGVLVSELSEEPWKGKVMTFSEDPELQIIQGDDLRSKVESVRRMKWGMNTDFQKVFDVILQVGVSGNLKAEDMIKRVIVFSDMEFDLASSNPWETDYEAIVRKFSENGFGGNVPEIVFWNLRDSKATPVPGNQKGVALVSGFSKNLMSLFIEEDGELGPEAIMAAAISTEEYKKLVIID